VGWRAATSMRTALVLDALEQAIWARRRGGAPGLAGLICHHDAGSQPRFKGSSQHCLAGPSIGIHRGPLPGSSSGGSCGGGC
jgi:hypothetical protein